MTDMVGPLDEDQAIAFAALCVLADRGDTPATVSDVMGMTPLSQDATAAALADLSIRGLACRSRHHGRDDADTVDGYRLTSVGTEWVRVSMPDHVRERLDGGSGGEP